MPCQSEELQTEKVLNTDRKLMVHIEKEIFNIELRLWEAEENRVDRPT